MGTCRYDAWAIRVREGTMWELDKAKRKRFGTMWERLGTSAWRRYGYNVREDVMWERLETMWERVGVSVDDVGG